MRAPGKKRGALVACMLAATLGVATPATAAINTAQLRVPATRAISQRADIDGDKRADTVSVALVRRVADDLTFRLTVRTAQGKVASTLFTAPDYVGSVNGPRDVFTGTSPMDGFRGDEIIVDVSGGVGEAAFLRSYTWRSNKLVVLPSPGRGSNEWTYSWFPNGQVGYTFTTVKGQRQVVVHEVHLSRVTHTRYASKGTGWVQIAKSSSRITQAQANKLAGWRGLKITNKI